MSRQVPPSTGKVYGLSQVTRLWGVARATLYRHRRPTKVVERRRPGPRGAMPDEDLVVAIRRLLTDSPFHGEGHRKLWARLRFAGIRTSHRRVLRPMRAHGLLAHQRASRPRGSKAHDGTITTERVDMMWGSDLTSVMTGEGQAAVFIAVDHCSAERVGVHASRGASRFEALEPVKQAVRERFGAFAKAIAVGLRLRHDHGSRYVSHDFQAEIRFLGIESSPAFVREPEGNGCAERFIRTLKENLLWVRHFATVEELRLALLAFKRTYNRTWIIELELSLGCVTLLKYGWLRKEPHSFRCKRNISGTPIGVPEMLLLHAEAHYAAFARGVVRASIHELEGAVMSMNLKEQL